MKTVWLIFAVALVFVTADLSVVAQELGAPHFENYPAAVWRGKVAALDLRSHALARMYKTLLREQLREGVNFAGHYTLASVGCGTGCSITAIIDARSGKAYFPSELEGWTSIVGDYDIPAGEDQRMFRTPEQTLRAIGRPNIGRSEDERHGPSGIYYYEWKNNRLRLVKYVHVGSYPDADPIEGR